MKIKKIFSDMQTKDNFIKLLEIRKENSLQKVLNQNMSIGLGNANFVVYPKGLLTVNMEIVDCDENCDLYPSMQDYNSAEEYTKEVKKSHNYKLVFDGYQRVKVSRFWKEVLSYLNVDCEHEDKTDLIESKEYSGPTKHYEFCKYKFVFSGYLFGNIDWIINYRDQIEEYLKNEEYCIVYFINK